MYKVKNHNLISRFSSCLLGRGKKQEGHKILFNLLLSLKVNTERELLDYNRQQNKLKTSISRTRFIYFLRSIGFQEKTLHTLFQKNEKAFQDTVKQYSQSAKLDIANKKSTFQIDYLKKDRLSQLPREFNKDSNNLTKQHFFQDETFSYLFSTQAFPNKSLCKASIDNVKPILETRKVRKGRMTYRIPLVTRTERQEGKAISWLIAGATTRKDKVKNNQSASLLGPPLLSTELKEISSVTLPTVFRGEKPISKVEGLSTIIEDKKKYYRSLQYCLAESFLEAFQGKGEGVEKRKQFHQLALQNRAYTHYRWW